MCATDFVLSRDAMRIMEPVPYSGLRVALFRDEPS